HRDAAAHRAGADDADLLDRQNRRIVRHVGDLPHLALGKEYIALRLRLRRRDEIKKRLALALHSLVEWHVDCGLHRAQGALPGFEAAEFAGVVAANLLENLRAAAGRFDLVGEIADFAQWHVRVDDLAGECERPLTQFSFLDKLVDDAPLQGLLGRKRRTGKDNFQRILDADQPRQALGAAGAGDDPKLDLGLPESRRWHGDPIVAHESYFATAAQCRAMDRSDDRLGAAFDRGLAVGQWSAFGRLAEFGNIGAGDEGAA